MAHRKSPVRKGAGRGAQARGGGREGQEPRHPADEGRERLRPEGALETGEGRLTLVCTPIGNLGDLTDRARQTLAEADLWLVEDTRQSGRLASALGLAKPMRLVTDHTSDAPLEGYVAEGLAGKRLALLTDGGAPGVSDPGARLADLAHEAGLTVDVAPGPSAVVAALALSGFYAQRFAFLGFLPRKPGPMGAELRPFAESPYTLVLFESPHRLDVLLAVAGETLGERRYAIGRELTKMHQQVFRNRLPYKPTEGEVPRRGEVTLVIEGKRRGDEQDVDSSD